MLTPDKTRYENGVKICEKIIPDSARASRTIASWVQKGQPMKPLKSMSPIGVTLHNTSDLKNVYDDAEQYTRATWPNCNMAGAVVHYFVDDVCAWQNLREDESGWHASDNDGPGNRRTIAIECIMDGSGSKEDLGARDNAAKLIAAIMKRYNWTVEKNLYTHNHWMGLPDSIVNGARKNCPLYILPEYSEFKSLVKKYMDESSDQPDTKDSTTSNITYIPYDQIKIGDTLKFIGDSHYPSAGVTAVAKRAHPSTVKVVNKYKSTSAHPIAVRAINENGNYTSKVNGWVDLKDLKKIGSTSYIVATTVHNLTVRERPNATSRKVTMIPTRGAYTIVDVENGWGLLKSYQKLRNGWINLAYTRRL